MGCAVEIRRKLEKECYIKMDVINLLLKARRVTGTEYNGSGEYEKQEKWKKNRQDWEQR